MPVHANVVAKASDAAFGRRLVNNALRGLLAEAIIAIALEPTWKWCSGDWASWDFEREDGLRLEVKQSSWQQSWAPPAHGRVFPRFDIRERTGRWEGAIFIAEPGRAAHLYVFAFHDVRDETADHRDPTQWEFYVLAAEKLPSAKSISLTAVRKLTVAIPSQQLFQQVQATASLLQPGFRC